ncbi:DUF4176 domain-containing protein [Sedimentibacter sp. zth1]|uniref:DUF4176 domain-containing protein n=1 Tax=Sedimentibacter sp. zth1 TaxID=2816908 RepID=UPI001A923E1B|nr:DUF4176 domain-containing protein [Sedimentibacter sp. zth1]QSX06763.1 DUF4176 domain-containing protein [Sedimentibacter sp. zth1]
MKKIKLFITIIMLMFLCSCSNNSKQNEIELQDEIKIGDVVILHGISKEVIVVGKNVVLLDSNTNYEYLGYFYEYGFQGDEGNIFFNKLDIEKIYPVYYKK